MQSVPCMELVMPKFGLAGAGHTKADGAPPVQSVSSGKLSGARSGSQTLLRGLDVLEAVSAGVTSLSELASKLNLNRSTAHRLASTLVERRYLSFAPRSGYGLGPKALEVGYQARAQLDITRVAREHLENLAAQTGDTVHLGVLDGRSVSYLDKIPGRRRIEISSRVGEQQPLRSTGLGKALLLDEPESQLREYYRSEDRAEHGYAVPENAWMERMRFYAREGVAFDLEENEDRIRCVAAPVRDATGYITAAISVSSAAQYMDDGRLRALVGIVKRTAELISYSLGWVDRR